MKGFFFWLPKLLACALVLASPGVVSADVPVDPQDYGNCGGSPGTVCRRTVRGRPSLGMCVRIRTGEVICATDEDSAKKAAEIEARRAERSRTETAWVLGGGAITALLLGGAIAFFMRKRKPEAAP